MIAIEITRPGAPDVLQAAERPMPAAGPGEILVKVAAAGVNRPDVLQRQGSYPPPPGASDLPGLEVAGIVEAVGEGVARFKAGDAVCALANGGGYAEYVSVPATQALPVPKGLGMVEAAGLPETYFTVWSNVFMRGRLAQGESLLVHGGASGIGTTAIQIATALGHAVYATVGSDARAAAVEQLGAAKGINYKTQDFVEEIKRLTGGKGVDVILDMVAGGYVGRDVQCLADDGRLVLIAMLGGTKGEVDFARVMMRRLTITGSTLRPRSAQFKGEIAQELLHRVWPLLEAGRIKPVVHATFPLKEAARAHAMMESGEHIGKIVLIV